VVDKVSGKCCGMYVELGAEESRVWDPASERNQRNRAEA
jgi:hypothetical protein